MSSFFKGKNGKKPDKVADEEIISAAETTMKRFENALKELDTILKQPSKNGKRQR